MNYHVKGKVIDQDLFMARIAGDPEIKQFGDIERLPETLADNGIQFGNSIRLTSDTKVILFGVSVAFNAGSTLPEDAYHAALALKMSGQIQGNTAQ